MSCVVVAATIGCVGQLQALPDGSLGSTGDGGSSDAGTPATDAGTGGGDRDGGHTPVDSGTSTPDASTPDSSSPEIRFTGRWEFSDPAHPKANFSGSGLEASFSGTQVSVTLLVDSYKDLYLMSVVDGAKPVRTKCSTGQHAYALATGLAAGQHTVRLALETEGMYGSVQFRSLDLGSGTLLAPPPRAALRMEVIGDSITCGYGNNGTVTIEDQSNNWSAPTCQFSTASESNYMAYGSVLARLLGAEVVSICFSGKGVYQDLDGNVDSASEPQLPSYYQDALVAEAGNHIALHQYPYPVAGHAQPYDVVLINLGTNDITGAGSKVPSTTPLRAAYAKLLGEVRANNPNAQVFLTIGTMTSDPVLSQFETELDAIITAAGDTKLHRVTLNEVDSSLGVGCDWHPTAAEDLRMALQLLHQMEPILGVTGRTTDPNPYSGG